jgi:hypothetical protein
LPIDFSFHLSQCPYKNSRLIIGVAYNILIADETKNKIVPRKFSLYSNNNTNQFKQEQNIEMPYHHSSIRLNSRRDDLNLIGNPIYYEHDESNAIGKILISWYEGSNTNIIGEI